MNGVPIGKIDVSATLIKHINTWEALNDKRLSPKDWVSELVSQVYSLSKICIQQQEEIANLNIRLNSMSFLTRP